MRTPFSILSHHVLPQHLLSRCVGSLAKSKNPTLKKTFIHWFANRYQVNMQEAQEPNLDAYACFNDFFTRALKPDARSIDQDPHSVVSPADGALCEIGSIREHTLIQAKGVDFDLVHLLGNQPHLAPLFKNGKFATIYLSPKDYHRVHMPLAGNLREMIYVPGRLFSVNFKSSQHVPNLFARNERMIALFDTHVGPLCVIMVGAMIVASINTVWSGQVTPSSERKITVTPYSHLNLNKGDEMGYFSLGSTVILLFGSHAVEWHPSLATLSQVKMGQAIGTIS